MMFLLLPRLLLNKAYQLNNKTQPFLGQIFMLRYRLNKYKEWWNTLAPREQRALMFAIMALVIFLAYALIWSPLNATVAEMREHITTRGKMLTWMQAMSNEINELQ